MSKSIGYKTSGGSIGRMFGGKKYLLDRQVYTKTEAQQVAEALRNAGYLARIVPKQVAFPGVTKVSYLFAKDVPYRWLVYRRSVK